MHILNSDAGRLSVFYAMKMYLLNLSKHSNHANRNPNEPPQYNRPQIGHIRCDKVIHEARRGDCCRTGARTRID